MSVGGDPVELERRRAEAALRRREEYFRALIENAADLIAVLEADGTVRYMSGSVTRILGYVPEELVGTNAFDLVHLDDLPAVLDAIQAGLEHRDTGLPMTFQARHKDGSWRFLEATDRNLLGEEAVAGIVINARDVTERVRAQEAVRDADRRKDEFLAMLAHELRNPLAPIGSAVEVLRLRGHEDPGLVHWAAELIGRQAQHLARLVDDLLDVSRITRGAVVLVREPVELSVLVARGVEIARPLIEARRHDLVVELPLEPLRIEADPVRLPQVVANLLDNAAKYTDPGGHIRLTADRRDREVEIRVHDDGIGIAADVLPRVFDLFIQGDRSLDRSQGGLGVGLTLVRRLVNLHGGTVAVISEGPGRGSEFVVRLPIFAESADERALAAETRPAVPGCRILVVDDNIDAAESLAMMLGFLGHEVATAHAGAAALEVASRFAPDVVLLDIGLPGMDGYEVARQLRAGKTPDSTLLVAITGYGRDEDRRRSREAGFDHHLVKPVEHDVLEAIIYERAARALAPAC